MSDAVAVALITGITSSVTTLATLIVAVLTRRKVKTLDQTVRDQHVETRRSLAASCHAPHDVSVRAPRANPKD
jgi:hypothetical protein